MIVIVSGDRQGYPPDGLTDYLDELYRSTPANEQLIIREGCARGVDHQVELWGIANGAQEVQGRSGEKSTAALVIEHWPALWNVHGKCWDSPNKAVCNFAGHRRNREMADAEPAPARVIAFHSNINSSKGTKRMIQIARQEDIPFEVIGSEPDWT